jgi:RNA polymerase sigma factor (sigma-70 family)
LLHQFKNSTDEALVMEFKANKNEAIFTELYNRYRHLVLGICLKYLSPKEAAQDAVQQIFEKLYLDLPAQNIAFFKAWLHTVSKNYCLMQLRKVKIPIKATDDIEKYDMENTDTMHLAIEKETNLNKMHDALGQLEPNQKICIEAFYLNKKSYNDIISITGFTFMEVKSYIQNGKRNLKNLMLVN